MKKLEDIPKKEIFTVPDGYFERLPGTIQSRVTTSKAESSVYLKVALRYALPALLVGTIAWFWITSSGPQPTAEDLVAEIATEDLIAYINESDLTTEEILNSVTLNNSDADAIQSSAYELDLSEESMESILDEIDINSL